MTTRVIVPASAITLFVFILMFTSDVYAFGINTSTNNSGEKSSETSNLGVGVVSGTIIDADSGEPVGWTSVLLVETARSVTAHENGVFTLINVPEGTYTLRTHRIGYEQSNRSISVKANDTTHVNIHLRKSVFRSRAIEVTGQRHNGDEVIEATLRIDGRELRQQLGRTLAETLQNEPGMAQSTMGPAPARPVLRGLSGDRLMVLEDGRTTGDVSTSSPDHAIAIDPINSEYIEILRGPASLIYSSNSMAGVVNVVRRQIPTELPAHFHGSASVQAESVNEGLSAGASVYGSRGNYGLKSDFGYRMASDIKTPMGSLDNTAIKNLHGGIGVSRIEKWGLIGVSGNIFRSSYGVPGNFDGSHPEGVKINLEREQADVRFDYYPSSDWLRRFRFDYTFSHYYHDELEFSPDRQQFDIVGSEYSLFKNDVSARFYHGQLGFAKQGVFGVQTKMSSYASGGFTYTPATNDYAAALFAYQDFELFERIALQAGLRFDAFAIVPLQEVETAIGLREQRNFANVSGGISANYRISRKVSLNAGIMRTVRMPGVEELFSEGPHLPSYSFEVGNPTLNEELGFGAESGITYSSDLIRIKNSWYIQRFSNYIYPKNTGKESVRRPLPIYQFAGEPVQMWGTELQVELNILSNLMLSGTISYVEGNLIDEDRPMPFIPPLTGKTDLQLAQGNFTFGMSARFASDQNRLGEFEEPTDGYVVFDTFMQYYISDKLRLHTFSLTFENLTDKEYRMHLSRVKSIMPEPGRNVKLLYRLYF